MSPSVARGFGVPPSANSASAQRKHEEEEEPQRPRVAPIAFMPSKTKHITNVNAVAAFTSEGISRFMRQRINAACSKARSCRHGATESEHYTSVCVASGRSFEYRIRLTQPCESVGAWHARERT